MSGERKAKVVLWFGLGPLIDWYKKIIFDGLVVRSIASNELSLPFLMKST